MRPLCCSRGEARGGHGAGDGHPVRADEERAADHAADAVQPLPEDQREAGGCEQHPAAAGQVRPGEWGGAVGGVGGGCTCASLSLTEMLHLPAGARLGGKNQSLAPGRHGLAPWLCDQGPHWLRAWAEGGPVSAGGELRRRVCVCSGLAHSSEHKAETAREGEELAFAWRGWH